MQSVDWILFREHRQPLNRLTRQTVLKTSVLAVLSSNDRCSELHLPLFIIRPAIAAYKFTPPAYFHFVWYGWVHAKYIMERIIVFS